MKLSLGIQQDGRGDGQGRLDGRVHYDAHKTTLNLLGMTLTEVTLDEERSKKLGSKQGVVVLLADRDRDAYLAGVRNGDLVAEVNSTRITRLQDVRRVLSEQDPHEPIFMFLWDGTGWRFVNLSFITSLP
ncbi:PDZ domain-containing protein [Geomonas nitrogeniifigens]|uniref:PDZ domain-containing protein n=1 Tax=Geomonas diazotrophica TaxID=2843197 RepID=A0ABX8JEU8_9BACT|nr:PDZ domain-containing protein [Geomonas nitrogeniifigens]QWV96843.1 PDZ domain-containing protein [Geomonas nitrogeniifigens]